MATQPTNLIDQKTLDRMRADLEGDRTVKMPDIVAEAVEAATEPVREIFVGVPELKTFLVGYAFGVATLAIAALIARF